MYTEDEAKELWCPMARVVHAITGNVAGNQIHHQDLGSVTMSTCGASKCSMWRWTYQSHRRFQTAENTSATTEGEAGPRMKHASAWLFCPAHAVYDSAGWIEPEESTRARWKGFCGLAPVVEVDRDPWCK